MARMQMARAMLAAGVELETIERDPYPEVEA
jgi:hypothetical protein